MKILVIGYGSIGTRHARLAAKVGHTVKCVSRNPECPYPLLASIELACSQWKPDKIILSNRTADHGAALASIADAGYEGDVLVEKPLFGGLKAPPLNSKLRVFVAYNLRFHPIIKRLRQLVNGGSLYLANFYAGQYLPDWRPQTDYRRSYSAQSEAGGGVLRDLSHELDLATWLCGPAERVAAIGGHFSDLEIRSDDVFSLLLEAKRCPAVTISVNYLDRVPQRTISVNGNGFSAFADLVNGTIVVDGTIEIVSVAKDDTYLSQLTAFIDGDTSTLCDASDGLLTDRLITTAELAASTASWQTVQSHLFTANNSHR